MLYEEALAILAEVLPSCHPSKALGRFSNIYNVLLKTHVQLEESYCLCIYWMRYILVLYNQFCYSNYANVLLLNLIYIGFVLPFHFEKLF